LRADKKKEMPFMEATAKNRRKAAPRRKKGRVVRKEPGEEYRLMVENAAQGILVLQDGRVRYANARVRGFLKKPIEELTPEVVANMIHPDDRSMVWGRYSQRLRGEEMPRVYSFRVLPGDGRVLWAEISVSMIEWEGRPATLLLAENITERKKMEAALAESEKTIRVLVDASPAVEFLVGPDGKILVYNQAFERFFGRDGKPLTGRNIQDLLSPEEIRVNRGKALEVLSTGKPVSFEDYQRGMWLEKSFSPILDEEGRVAKIACYGMDISEKKRAAEALKENELRYRLLAENVSDYLWATDRNLLPTYVSPGVTSLLGYTPEELMAIRLEDLLTPDSLPLVWKAYTQEKAKEEGGVKEQPKPQILVLEYRRKDGSTLWAETRVRPVFDSEGKVVSIVGITQDISDRKKAEEDLQESERRYRLLADNATDFIWTMDWNLRLTYVSPAVTRLLGYTPEEFMAEPLEKSLPPDSWALVQKVYAEELSEERKDTKDLSRTRTLELEYLCKGGSTVWAESKISAIRGAGGKIVEIIGVTRDITKRKKAEKELIRHQAHLEEMVRDRTARILELEQQRTEIEKMAATGVLAARIAHEINNPLAGIKGAFMLIKDAVPLEHQYHHYIDRIQKEINRIARIVRQMFELYRPPDEDQEEWTLDQMIQDVTSLLKDECRERGVSIQFDLPPLMVRLPAGPVRQVLFNTIKNAVEASPLQGVVRIAVEKKQEKIVIRVRDQGPGISEEIRPHIFEPFYTTKRGKRGGLGLGLSISKDIVESLGGSIHFQNQSGRGVLCRIVFSHKKRKKDPKDG
jgi:PAS domain S-box-containing protein